MDKRKMTLLIPALWASLFDIAITIIHQSAEYWKGNLSKANEANPIGKLFMEHHTSGLFVLSALWIGVIILLGYFLPARLARIFLLFCVMAHSFGASTWISRHYGFWYVMIFILFNSILYCTIDQIADKMNGGLAIREVGVTNRQV